jgi:hypothetical protein
LLSEEQLHIETVKAEAQRKQEVKEEKERQLAVKMEEKRKRRDAKEAKKRAEERANLRAEIEAQFIAKGTTLDPIVAQEILEMDGGAGDAKAVVGAVGGVLGQIILVLSILEKNFNRQMTSKSKQSKKSSKSGKSGSKKVEEEAKRQADEDAKSGLGEASKTDRDGAATPAEMERDGTAEPVIKEKGWFTKQNIQNFLHHFIGERLKTEKLPLTVGAAYQRFLEGLEKPMKLNEMRNMKEPNYSKLREVLRDPRLYGDPVLRMLAEHSELVGISANTYHMVHEGFWDLYCKKPATPDLTAKKLDGW